MSRSVPLLALLTLTAATSACLRSEPRIDAAARSQTLLIGNGTEPESIDPQIATGVPENRIIAALFEGLVGINPKTLEPVADSAAERWEISEDRLTYTFHLRPHATWSNGDPVTAHDFVYSYYRILSPKMAAKNAYMLYPLRNAEAFNTGKTSDFSTVGVRAVDDFTLELQLEGPTPFLLGVLDHYSWYPVHRATIQKHGGDFKLDSLWTRPGNIVGNGPYELEEWKLNNHIIVRKRDDYWDANRVTLNRVYYHPIDNGESEQRAFRRGFIHLTSDIPVHRIEWSRKHMPETLRLDPYLGTYYYRINISDAPADASLRTRNARKALQDPRVRRALNLAINREAVCRFLNSGQLPAYSFVPGNAAGYKPEYQLTSSAETAQSLLAEAGFPGGEGFPPIQIVYNTLESHKQVAEIIQQQLHKNLGIEVELLNQDWKVYLQTVNQLEYDLARAGWIGDYADPNSFLDLWLSGSGNNQTGFANAEYDSLVRQAARAADPEERIELFQKAERILLEEMPVIPVYFYVSKRSVHPHVVGWEANLLDRHPLKYVSLRLPGSR
jgi:oligopeptide transport system substrate-binding protein